MTNQKPVVVALPLDHQTDEMLATALDFGQRLQCPFVVVHALGKRRMESEPGIASRIAKAKQTLGLAVDQDDAPGRFGHQHRVRRCLDGLFKAPLEAAAGADVHDDAENVDLVLMPYRLQRDLDREGRAVAALCVQLASRSHGTLGGVPKVSGAQRWMRRARRFGDEEVDRLTQQLVVGITEQQLGLPIGQQDAAGVIDDQHRDRPGVERRIEQLLG